jgi:hypothetical protein
MNGSRPFAFLIVLGYITAQEFHHHIENVAKPNLGVIFTRHQRSLLNEHSASKLLFKIQLPKLTILTIDNLLQVQRCGPTQSQLVPVIARQQFTTTTPSSPVCDEYLKLQDAFRQAIIDKLLTVHRQNEAIHEILSTPITLTKPGHVRTNRREILPFIGQISRTLFGTATLSDVRNLMTQIETIEDNFQTHVVKTDRLKDELFHFVNISQEQLISTNNKIAQNKNIIVSLLSKLQKWKTDITANRVKLIEFDGLINTLIHLNMGFFSQTFAQFQSLQQVYDVQSDFLIAFRELVAGQLSHTLVPPDELKAALLKIQEQVKSNYPSYKLLHTNLDYYYASHLSSYVYTNNSLFVYVDIPLVSSEPIFDLYEVTTLPVPTNTNNTKTTEMSYTQVTGLPFVLAVSQSRTTYFCLSQSQLSSCKGERFLKCPKTFPYTQVAKPNCAIAIFLDQTDNIKQYCQIKVFTNIVFPTQAVQLEPSTYFISMQVNRYQLVCSANSIRQQPACKMCIIHIPCGCSIFIDQLALPGTIQECVTDITIPLVKHAFNYAMLLHFHYDLPDIHVNALYDEPVNLKLPNLHNYIKNFTDISSKDKALGLKIQQVKEAIASHNFSYNTPKRVNNRPLEFHEYLQHPQAQVTSIIFTICVTAIGFAVIIWLYCRLRTVTKIIALLSLSHQLPNVRAVDIEIPNRIDQTPEPIESANTSPFEEYYTLIAAVTIISICIAVANCIYCIGKISFKLPKPHNKLRLLFGPAQRTANARVYLKIIHPKFRVILYLFALNHEPNVIKFSTAPHIVSARVRQNFLCHRLKLVLQWSDYLTLYINGIPQAINLPHEVLIPFFLVATVKNIFQPPETLVTLKYFLLLKRYTDPQYVEIPSAHPLYPVLNDFQTLPFQPSAPIARPEQTPESRSSIMNTSPISQNIVENTVNESPRSLDQPKPDLSPVLFREPPQVRRFARPDSQS